jgi:Est1-like DNA/RNA binding protein
MTSSMIKQPATRPISQEQLVAEVKGIYAGLILVETKCIEVDNTQNAQTELGTTLKNEQWQALIALHRTLLHEHHDFFLASQHPSAAPALRRLATKYAMPARMWRHGIHSFLELLRYRLPASLEHMLSFIYLAYSMMALLYETVPAFEETWIECLGDLGRYRMAIEDDDIRHREVWTTVSRNWYSKASDKAPTTGRLYHHLAILARPNGFQQLFYYTKSMCVAIQFDSARESIMTLLEPVMSLNPNHVARLVPTELEFVKCHGILFSGKNAEKYEAAVDEFINSLDNFIARNTRKFLEQGYVVLSFLCPSNDIEYYMSVQSSAPETAALTPVPVVR